MALVAGCGGTRHVRPREPGVSPRAAAGFGASCAARVSGGLSSGYRRESLVAGPLALYPVASEYPTLDPVSQVIDARTGLRSALGHTRGRERERLRRALLRVSRDRYAALECGRHGAARRDGHDLDRCVRPRAPRDAVRSVRVAQRQPRVQDRRRGHRTDLARLRAGPLRAVSGWLCHRPPWLLRHRCPHGRSAAADRRTISIAHGSCPDAVADHDAISLAGATPTCRSPRRAEGCSPPVDARASCAPGCCRPPAKRGRVCAGATHPARR